VTRLSQAFKAHRDIDAIAEDVAILDDDVACVDADAQLDAVVGGHTGVALGHLALHLDGTARGMHHTAQLDQQPIAGDLDDAPPCSAIFGLKRSWHSAWRRSSRPSSSALITREYPATSAHP
jgi:hypothetical protein